MSWLITPQLKSTSGIPWDQVPASLRWTPALITTSLWLDAADGATITSADSRISQWSDKSGSNRHATQSTDAQKPKITTNGLNGRSVVEFDPASNSYQRLSFTRLTSLGHVFFVARKNNVNDSSVILDDNIQDSRAVGYGAVTGSNFTVQNLAPTNTGATRNVWHIAEIATDGTNATLGIDANRVTAADADRYSTDRIGMYNNNSTTYVNQASFRGQIAEIVVSSSVLTQANREKLEGYLAHKWGLISNLPSNHPYKTASPTA